MNKQGTYMRQHAKMNPTPFTKIITKSYNGGWGANARKNVVKA